MNMLKLLSFVGRNWPFSHGTGWLVERPAHLIKTWPTNQQFSLKDGRIFQGDLNDHLFRSLYLYGDYEPVVSEAMKSLIQPGDHVVDVGANVGIMTALMGHLVGNKGHVYSFEPVPTLYEILQKTILLNDLADRVSLYNLLVGDANQSGVNIYVPTKHLHPCSSLVLEDQASGIAHSCQMIALSTFHSIPAIPALVKVDVEGAENLVLLGAFEWLTSHRPPIWLLEINRKAAARFSYQPQDMITWLRKYNDYSFFWADNVSWHDYKPDEYLPDNGMLCALPEWVKAENRFLEKH